MRFFLLILLQSNKNIFLRRMHGISIKVVRGQLIIKVGLREKERKWNSYVKNV